MDEARNRIEGYNRIDLIEEACDQIDFTACALSQMMGEYDDKVVCGCTNILLNASNLIREYANQQHRALSGAPEQVEAEA